MNYFCIDFDAGLIYIVLGSSQICMIMADWPENEMKEIGIASKIS